MKNQNYPTAIHTDEEQILSGAYVTYDLDGDNPFNIYLDFDGQFALKLEGEALTYFYNKIKGITE